MNEKLKKNVNNDLQNDKIRLNKLKSPISQGSLKLLGLITLFSLITGFFIIISIIVDVKQNKHQMFSQGLIIGFLLFSAGIVLLTSYIILTNKFYNQPM